MRGLLLYLTILPVDTDFQAYLYGGIRYQCAHWTQSTPSEGALRTSS